MNNQTMTANDFREKISDGTITTRKKGRLCTDDFDRLFTIPDIITAPTIHDHIEDTQTITSRVVPPDKPKKGKSEKPTEDGIVFDSNEELHFYWYLKELKKEGFCDFQHHPDSYNLSFPVSKVIIKEMKKGDIKLIERELLKGHKYTPDFKIIWDRKALEGFYENFHAIGNTKAPFITNTDLETDFSIIEIKPSYNQNNMTREFVINQKWVMAQYGTYVQKIIPEHLFKATFTPNRYLFTDKSGQPRKINYEPRTLKEFLNGNI